MFEPDEQNRIHTAQEVAVRCLVLYVLCLVAHRELTAQAAVQWLKQEDLWASVAPSEIEFLQSSSPTKQQTIDATWRAEALWALLWSIGLVAELDTPTTLVDPQQILPLVPKPSTATARFIKGAQLRSEEEILDACDEIFEIHWSVRDAELNGREIPNAYHPGVVKERHFALNWLTYYDDEWDEITTDT